MRARTTILLALLFFGVFSGTKAQQNKDIHEGFAVQFTGSISPYFPYSFLFHQQAPNHFSAGAIAGTYLSKTIFVGGGIEFAGSRGVHYGLERYGQVDRQKGAYLYGTPVFFDFKANCLETRVAPFAEVRLGINSNLNKVTRTDVVNRGSNYDLNTPRNGKYYLMGAYVSLALGVKVGCSSFGLGCNLNTVHYDEDLYYSANTIEHQTGSRMCQTLFFRYTYTYQK